MNGRRRRREGDRCHWSVSSFLRLAIRHFSGLTEAVPFGRRGGVVRQEGTLTSDGRALRLLGSFSRLIAETTRWSLIAAGAVSGLRGNCTTVESRSPSKVKEGSAGRH